MPQVGRFRGRPIPMADGGSTDDAKDHCMKSWYGYSVQQKPGVRQVGNESLTLIAGMRTLQSARWGQGCGTKFVKNRMCWMTEVLA